MYKRPELKGNLYFKFEIDFPGPTYYSNAADKLEVCFYVLSDVYFDSDLYAILCIVFILRSHTGKPEWFRTFQHTVRVPKPLALPFQAPSGGVNDWIPKTILANATTPTTPSLFMLVPHVQEGLYEHQLV